MSHISVCMQTQIHSKTQLTIWVGHTGNYLSISYSHPCFINSMFKLHNKSNILITYVIDFPFNISKTLQNLF